MYADITKKPILFHQDLRFFMNEGGSLRDVSIDCLAVLLFEMSCIIKKNIIVSFVLERHAYSLYKILSSFKEHGVYYYPNLSNNERVPGFELETDRYRDEALVQLRSSGGCGVCVGTEESFHNKNIPLEQYKNISKLNLVVGGSGVREEIVDKIHSWNYKKVDSVYEPLQYSVRGEIIDIFPMYFRLPARVSIGFEKIERIGFFDPNTQITLKTTQSLELVGTSNNSQRSVYIDLIEHCSGAVLCSVVSQDPFFVLSSNGGGPTKSLRISPVQFRSTSIDKRIEFLLGLKEKYQKLIIVGEKNLCVSLDDAFPEAQWLSGHIKRSFYSSVLDALVVSCHELFKNGTTKERWMLPESGEIRPLAINSLSGLKSGDFVVHRNFGIGVYRGLVLQSGDGGRRESIEIEYGENARVYVSLEKMNLVHQYVGTRKNPIVSALGSSRWKKDVSKTKSAVRLVAKELLDLYAIKNLKRPFSYSRENELCRALVDSFPFVETYDQKRAIDETLSDMDGPTVLDRVVCGDVGFGKTEVALRAMMKAAISNKQSIFLCPTTILADQHYITCRERLEPVGVSVGLLSRFKTRKEQSKIINRLHDGAVDVLVGTHRILSQDVSAPNLGLLVVDEEHRFGVAHKEQIRQLKKRVDLLTLTATPIPRTLQHSLVGIREISTIRTPPKTRKPIKTAVRYFDWGLVRSYIENELERRGQVYFLHNEARALPYYKKSLQKHFPDAIVEHIHGTMKNRELETKILSFFNGGIDILVCTTIIESGLDVSNANCMIINNAQNFGLSQLYQIRGRVGRRHEQAHCLLLVPKKPLDKNAHRRLKTIEQFTSLGSGYDVSIKDLEIRGAGSLFGYKQSGHVSSVGYEMYCDLLKDELNLAAGRDTRARYPNIVFSNDSLIGESYLNNQHQRLDFYSRLSRADSGVDIRQIAKEMEDRFGKIPGETKNLVSVAMLRVLYKDTSIKTIDVKDSSALLTLDSIKPFVSLDLLFESVSEFSIREKTKHHFGKAKAGDFLISFSSQNVQRSISLLLKCVHLFSSKNGN